MTTARELLAGFTRAQLRRALWFMRRQTSRPGEVNPCAAQYNQAGVWSAEAVRAEYRRRGWKVPKPTRAKRP